MTAQAGVLYGRIKFGTVSIGPDGSGFFMLTVYGHDVEIAGESHNMPGKHMEGRKVRAMCSDAGDKMTLIDLEIVPDEELDDRQGLIVMSVMKHTKEGVKKVEVARHPQPEDGDEKAHDRFMRMASSLLNDDTLIIKNEDKED